MKNFDSNGRMTKERVMEVVEHCEKKIASLDFQTKWTSSPGPYDDGALDGQISAYQDVLDMLDLAEEEIKAKLKSDEKKEFYQLPVGEIILSSDFESFFEPVELHLVGTKVGKNQVFYRKHE